MSVEERFRRLAREMDAAKDRVRELMSRPHALTDGEWKERVLREVLERMLPRRYVAGSGFIVGEEESSQIDILIYDAEAPLLDRYGDVVYVTPDAVRGIIEVKTTAARGKLTEAFEKLANNARIAAGALGEYQPGLPFVGLYAYGIDPDDRPPEWALAELRAGQARVNGPPIGHVCLGPSFFVHYWGNEPGVWRALEPYQRWHLYGMKDLAPGYFVTNVIESLAAESVRLNRAVWYPEQSKEISRIGNIGRDPHTDLGQPGARD